MGYNFIARLNEVPHSWVRLMGQHHRHIIQLIRVHGQGARPFLAKAMGVSLPTVTNLVKDLLADGIIITGAATGEAAEPAEVVAARRAVRLPVLVGSGVTPDNLPRYAAADAIIVGSWVKHEGSWENPLEPARAAMLAAAFRALPAQEAA